MGNTAELVIALLAKDAASSVLGNVGAKLEGLGRAGDIAKIGLGALTAGIGAAVVAGIGFAKAAADEEQGVERMRQAITNTGQNWRDYSDDIEETIFRMERLTAFSDGEMRDAMSTLISQTGDATEALKRLPIATDFARGAHIDLATASKLLSKVTDENVNALARYGIHMQKGADATEVLAEVQKRFSGQSEAFANTAAGKWQIFQNQMDNLKEDIGGALLPAFSGLADVATGAIDAIRGALANPAVQGAITAITEGLGVAKQIVVELFGVISGSAPDAGAALTRAIGPEAAKFIMGAFALLRDTVKAVMTGDIPGALATLGARVPDLIGQLTGMVSAAIPKITDALLGWGKEFIAWVAPQIPPLLAELLGLLKTGLTWLADHTEDIGTALAEWGIKFGTWIGDVALPALVQYLPGIVGALLKFVLVDAPSKLGQAFINFAKGLIGKFAEGIGEAWGQVSAAFGDMIRRAVSAIDFWVGPFHISGTGGITVQMPTISFPSLSPLKLAAGGSFVTRGPMPLIVGDNASGRELVSVTPLGGGGGVARAMDGGLGQPLEIPVIIDGREVARALGPAVIPLAALATGRRL
jgi:hypothetical protein